MDIILPAYQKKQSIISTLRGIHEAVNELSFHIDFSFVVVVDGDDGTVGVIETFHDFPVKVILNEANKGKGFSQKKGFLDSNSEVVVFFDADLDINPTFISTQLVELLKNEHWTGVVGAKNLKESKVEYPILRKMYSFTFRALVSLLFRTDILDSQTGAKLFRRSHISKHLSTCTQEGFLFDLELLLKLINDRAIIHYSPVEIHHQYNSSVSVRDVISIFMQILVMKKHLGAKSVTI